MMQKQHKSGIELVDGLAVQETSHLTTFIFATDHHDSIAEDLEWVAT